MEEPILKYPQISLQITDKNDKTDQISAFAITSDDKIVFGTEHGRCVVAKLSGETLIEYTKSDAQITYISVDSTGKFVLFSTGNGNLNLYPISENKSVITVSHGVSISACALDPNYASTKEFNAIFSDTNGSIIRISQGWLRMKKTTISENEGFIQTVWWKNGIIAWASFTSINVIREKNEEKLYKITPVFPNSPIQNPRCTFLQLSDSILGLSFGSLYYELWLTTTREIVVNVHRNVLSLAVQDSITMQLFYDDAKKECMFYIDQNLTISYVSPPENAIKPSKYVTLLPTTKGKFILVLDQFVYCITFSSWAERLQMHLDRNEDQLCLKKFESMLPSLTDNERVDLVMRILSHFIKSKSDYNKAAELCNKYLKPRNEEWDRAIELFQNNDAISSLASYVPLEELKNTPKLVPILRELIHNDTQRFCQVFSNLPPDSFDPKLLINDVQIKADSEKVFHIPLMILYHRIGEHSKAFDSGLTANYLNLFDDIEKYQLYDYPLKRFDTLYRTYGDIFTQFMLSHTEQMKPILVLPNFKTNTVQMCQHMLNYLHQLYKMHIPIPKPYGTDLAVLYIKFHHPETMNYLLNSSEFDYTVARQTAIDEKLYREAAFLSKKTGAILDGMRIHLNNIKNPKETVEYAIQVADKSVWDELTLKAYDDPALLQVMLDNLPSLNIKFDEFIRNIPDKLMSKELIQSIARALKEFKRRMKTAQLTQEIVANAAFDLFEKQMNAKKRARIRSLKV
ncbi:vacuolar protein sorting-associated protein 41 [Histomonas meleagridis]|uniref:vacuolar protein sorting-associated protein 41-like n=1 Tax=Histomonas meleagridis TaxID=135588 RepID=UPI00355A59B5|nr:vacuolar protein sorting-associated protein 41 [Histomonas meleagridis]KAH0801063.1 vacuolar protein sorting-associated protein 41-like [Histomonas meleagridis]